MKTRTCSRIALLACGLAWSLALPAHAAEPNTACSLLTPAELEGVLGGKVTLRPQGGTESASMCTGATAKARVLLRVAKSREGSGDAAKAGVEAARQMGAQVDVKTFGPMTCSTMVPPERLAAHGYNTTCTVTKGDSVAGVEITAKAKADMVPIDRLKPVAEKMTGRF